MTEEERRLKIEEIRDSARLTDELIARHQLSLDLALERLRRAVARLVHTSR
ncbi:MAG TPA: hypothetical protein VHN37_00760 [Actinomycetota bacterium]|nr:hypothetical protein [Actinomycetota bacterium]